jgi:ribosomal protein S18 acetylase RimI-like enzyme
VSEGRLRREAITVRIAEEGDRAALEAFASSSGLECEDEVDDFIRTRALDTHLSGVAGYRLLLAVEDEALAGIVAHRIDILTLKDGRMFNARLIQVLAVSPAHRGCVFDDGSRLSDALLAAVVKAVGESDGSDIFTAIVANENDRALAVLERSGTWSQVAYDHLHVRLTGRFKI